MVFIGYWNTIASNLAMDNLAIASRRAAGIGPGRGQLEVLGKIVAQIGQATQLLVLRVEALEAAHDAAECAAAPFRAEDPAQLHEVDSARDAGAPKSGAAGGADSAKNGVVVRPDNLAAEVQSDSKKTSQDASAEMAREAHQLASELVLAREALANLKAKQEEASMSINSLQRQLAEEAEQEILLRAQSMSKHAMDMIRSEMRAKRAAGLVPTGVAPPPTD